MKKWIVGAAALLVAAFIADYLRAPREVRAQTVEQASMALATTERAVHAAASATNAQARHLQQRLDTPDRKTALPQELQDFNLATERLRSSRENLHEAFDIA